MENNKCKTKDCPRILPEGYKYKHCEHCRGQHVNHFKDACKTALGVVAVVGSIAIAIANIDKTNPKD